MSSTAISGTSAAASGGPVRSIDKAVVLVTGASGGIGAALVEALHDAGAAEVIASGREAPVGLRAVTPIVLDITDAEAVARAGARYAERIDILINCAGVNANRRLFSPDFVASARREIEVNYLGLLNVLAAFAPAMKRRRGGVIVNLLSFLSHVNLPLMATYCAAKAAAHSITQAARAELAPSGVLVCGVYPTVVDTRMSAQVPGPKLSAAELASAVIEAVCNGTEDLYPGAAGPAQQAWLADPKQVERRMAQRLG